MMMRRRIATVIAPMTKPPMNKPLKIAVAGVWLSAGLLQLVQSWTTAVTLTGIPSTIKKNGTWLASLSMITEAVSDPSSFEYSMVALYISLPLSSQLMLE